MVLDLFDQGIHRLLAEGVPLPLDQRVGLVDEEHPAEGALHGRLDLTSDGRSGKRQAGSGSRGDPHAPESVGRVGTFRGRGRGRFGGLGVWGLVWGFGGLGVWGFGGLGVWGFGGLGVWGFGGLGVWGFGGLGVWGFGGLGVWGFGGLGVWGFGGLGVWGFGGLGVWGFGGLGVWGFGGLGVWGFGGLGVWGFGGLGVWGFGGGTGAGSWSQRINIHRLEAFHDTLDRCAGVGLGWLTRWKTGSNQTGGVLGGR